LRNRAAGWNQSVESKAMKANFLVIASFLSSGLFCGIILALNLNENFEGRAKVVVK
jgi:hypothetical protein